MSESLYWRAIPEGEELSLELKGALHNRFSLNEINNRTLTREDKDYFLGLKHAGIEDAQKILDGIDKFEEIEIFIE